MREKKKARADELAGSTHRLVCGLATGGNTNRGGRGAGGRGPQARTPGGDSSANRVVTRSIHPNHKHCFSTTNVADVLSISPEMCYYLIIARI